VTQLDVDDVNNNGNRNESIPVASHIAKNDVGETCSVVTGTIEPYIVLSEVFSEAALVRASNGNVLYFRDDTNKEFVNLAMLPPYGYAIIHDRTFIHGIILDRTFIGTTTITIDPTNGLSALEGDVSNNGNYMICASDCEATTKDTFMIGSNNADDSVIEFTVNIPEIETGIIDIGLTDFYLMYDGDSHTMYLVFWDGVTFWQQTLLDGWYTGPHTFRFEFHQGRAVIKMDNEVLLPEAFFPRSFYENGMKFFVRNTNTGTVVQIGTIAITIDEYAFATTGTYISSIYDISTPNFITGTTDVMVFLYHYFAQLEQYTNFTLEYQLSLDGGATWGDWQSVALYNNTRGMYERVASDFLRNISLENARIRLRVTLSNNNTKFSPEIEFVFFRI